ncbi:MAG: citrate lyase holo-[acyl-carrier protein] synthase [Muribaculaceae bacterium]|nr:citrate lyase holo-[acyl-carrier protein] synthase [Muribaculaceae bacterium]
MKTRQTNLSVAATLDEVLLARDERAGRHARLVDRPDGETLLALTVIVPGAVKRNLRSLTVDHAAMSAVLSVFNSDILSVDEFDFITGFEADFIIARPAEDVKRIAVAIEETHPLGRLFDLDVIMRGGRPMSRDIIGAEARRCLCCDRPARYCMRARTHSSEEISDMVDSIVDKYIAAEQNKAGFSLPLI